jgi:hypothetical protein
MKFEREKHVYRSKDFDEIIKDTIRFFNGTPVHKLPPPEKFHGTGVYAIYYTGKAKIYQAVYDANRTAYNIPIYVGKAVPKGWRQARTVNDASIVTHELFGRLTEHYRSVQQGFGIQGRDFHCRFMILEEAESSLISTVEAALIRLYRPLWNTAVDGFGNHDPGGGRYEQAKSDWDVIHPGRSWADKCKGKSGLKNEVLRSIASHAAQLGAKK